MRYRGFLGQAQPLDIELTGLVEYSQGQESWHLPVTLWSMKTYLYCVCYGEQNGPSGLRGVLTGVAMTLPDRSHQVSYCNDITPLA